MSKLFASLWRVLVIASIITVAATLAIWAFDRRPPITILSAVVEDTEIEQGGLLHIDYRLEQHRRCVSDLSRWIVDSRNVIHHIDIYASGPEVGGVNDFRVSIPVPLGAAVGPARYQAMLHYRCNPLQRVTGMSIDVATPQVNFTILPRLPPGMG